METNVAGTSESTNAEQMLAGVQVTGGGSTQSGAQAPASGTTPTETGQSPGGAAVLGANAGGGGSGSSGGSAGASARAPSSAFATRSAARGTLPYTGEDLVFLLLAAAGCLISGLALRRAVSSQS